MNFLELFLLMLTFFLKISDANSDPVQDQLPRWAKYHSLTSKVSTSALGSPSPSQVASLSSSKLYGPIFVQDTNFFEILAHFVRERIPERVVHARGAGAHGIFTVTNDISRYTKAKVFKLTRKTRMFVRFSIVTPELGGADTVQDPRGFALKFYTRDGIWDLVGNNFPVFPIRDPILFMSLIHSRKRNPQTHIKDQNMFWDFVSLRPETIHHTLRKLSDLGFPDGYRHMDGFGVNAFKFVNSNNEINFVKFTYKTQQGIRNLTYEDATRIAGQDPDYAIRDLYNAIESKNFPSWKMYIQIMTPDQAKAFAGAFDAVQIWPEDQFPLILVGEFTLNRNQENFFAEVEQVAFDPGNLVPGIEMSPDRLLQGRSFSYTDAQRYRLGPNFLTLPINRPINPVYNYMRDGQSCLDNEIGPPYFPNSFGGPSDAKKGSVPLEYVQGKVDRYDSGPIGDNFSQANTFYMGLDSDQKKRLVENIVRSLGGVDKGVVARSLALFANVNAELATKVMKGLRQKSSNDK